MSPLAFANTKSVIPTLPLRYRRDELLGGGFPRLAVSEITGNQSNNRTALTVSILVYAFDAGECCAWIDAGGTFDPESAAEAPA